MKETQCSGMGKLPLLKVPPLFLLLVFVFKAIPTKLPRRCLVNIDIIFLKFLWKDTGLQKAKIVLTKNKKVAGASPWMTWVVAWLQSTA